MLHPVNKKRLQQAIDAYEELEDYRDKHGITMDENYDLLWNIFYKRASYCCEGGHNNSIPSLIYSTEKKRRTAENIYYAILILGYNDTIEQGNGDEYYE